MSDKLELVLPISLKEAEEAQENIKNQKSLERVDRINQTVAKINIDILRNLKEVKSEGGHVIRASHLPCYLTEREEWTEISKMFDKAGFRVTVRVLLGCIEIELIKSE